MTRSQIANLLLTVFLVLSVSAGATDRAPVRTTDGIVFHGAPVGTAKTAVDTIYVLGGPDRLDGSFEDAMGQPDWNGWTHMDESADSTVRWNVSTFNAVSGTYSMWCGTDFDGDPGYGNDWNQGLMFTYQVTDNSVNNVVLLTGTLRIDVEENWDYVLVEWNDGGIWTELQDLTGAFDHPLNETVTYEPADYVGDGNDEIQLRIRVTSDGAASDEDGYWPSDGACQLDDVAVTVGGVVVDSEDFEDQISDNWLPVLYPGVGDFAALYSGLEDIDPCRSNSSVQVAFVDDGVVVPGTGGTQCITWCYGPSGYIVNNTGGLLGPGNYLDNRVMSPVRAWPAGYEGATIAFDVCHHEELGENSPGILYTWYVRSTADPVLAPIADQPWRNRDFIFFNFDGTYRRRIEDVATLLEPGSQQIQMCFRVQQAGWNWGWYGTDGTPTPYFDNAAILAYPFTGPAIAARAVDLANDGFPASGALDVANLAANAVRFDMAGNISPASDLRNDPGDSIVADVAVIRAGAVLDGLPRMYVHMQANPLFDGVRALPDGFSQTGDIITGWVDGAVTYDANESLVDDRYNFDLPDDDFFFPGDVIHYYLEARDNLGGDVGITVLPEDTTGFAQFDDENPYTADFTVRALPSLATATAGDHPPILVWNDAAGRGDDEWRTSLGETVGEAGIHYDIYTTNAPTSGAGNGLGGRATVAQLNGYETLIYTAGDLSRYLLSNGDFAGDPGDDIGLITDWLALGDRNAVMTGDNLVTDLLSTGAAGTAFVSDYFDVTTSGSTVRFFIADQTAPLVMEVPGNEVFQRIDRWIAYGGCPTYRSFDALEVGLSAAKLAGFTASGGDQDVYPYAAAVANRHDGDNAAVVLLPYDLAAVHDAPGWTPPAGYEGMAARTIMLWDILGSFGGWQPPLDAVPGATLSLRSYPNPFNPTTTIALNVPRAGKVRLRVFDVRGRAIRTLVDGDMTAGLHRISWNGRNDDGHAVASGVYLAQVRTGGETRLDKLTLMK